MSNPLLNAIGNAMPQNNMIQRFQEFKKTFQGNPEQQVRELLNSGKMSQDQFNQLAQMANQLSGLLK